MACTQFAAKDARRAFPCWDEPALKASFDVTLVVPKDRLALSNMPVKAATDHVTDGAWKVVRCVAPEPERGCLALTAQRGP